MLELLLLNLAFHIRDAGLAGFAIAAVEGIPEDAERRGGVLGLRPGARQQRSPPAAAPLPVGSGPTLATTAALVTRERRYLAPHPRRDRRRAFLAEFWLPAAPRIAAKLQPARSMGLKILLVESDGLVRASVAEVLGDLGHAVVQAASGRTPSRFSSATLPSTR